VSKQSPATSHFDKTKARRANDPLSAHRALAADAILSGTPLPRKLTKQERRTIAVASCLPTHLLTVNSTASRKEVMHAFSKLKKRILRDRGRPLMYVGTCARSSTGAGGYHLHLLLWEYKHMKALLPDLRDVGLGGAKIDPLVPNEDTTAIKNAIITAGYVFGQEEPVFGTDKHLKNLLRPKGAYSALKPQGETLAQYHPELLAALDKAKDPALPDDDLLSALPYLDMKSP
jgi:hypothetical protein